MKLYNLQQKNSTYISFMIQFSRNSRRRINSSLFFVFGLNKEMVCVGSFVCFQAQVHRHVHNFREVQQCTLLSIKTGGCSEDCSYFPQSSRYSTGVKAQRLMSKDAVIDAAKKAKEAGSRSSFCMDAAWRDTVGRKTNFNQILEYIKEIRGMGMEVCCTLGMIEKQQALELLELKKAGLTAYNQNLDTSRDYHPNVITTRSYDDRLETLDHVREAGINVCSDFASGEASEATIIG